MPALQRALGRPQRPALPILQHCLIVYVTTDMDDRAFAAQTENKPFHRMVLRDGSDFAPIARSEAEVVAASADVGATLNDEEFMTAEVGPMGAAAAVGV